MDHFIAISEFGRKLAEIEKGDFEIAIDAEDLAGFEYHKFKIEDDSIILLDNKGDIAK